jgi:hypothetical protein
MRNGDCSLRAESIYVLFIIEIKRGRIKWKDLHADAWLD